jgi:DNA mismatch repair protein MutS
LPRSATAFRGDRAARLAPWRAWRKSARHRRRRWRRCAAPTRHLAAEFARALAENCRRSAATAASCAGLRAGARRDRALRDESRRVAALQARYAETTGVKGLKIRHNNVLGYFVEVTAQHGDKLMSAPRTRPSSIARPLAGQVRFTTTELGEIEAKIANAADRALGLELEIFERLAAR